MKNRLVERVKQTTCHLFLTAAAPKAYEDVDTANI
jgi:hypothetical protein